jgi:hypothetical protein
MEIKNAKIIDETLEVTYNRREEDGTNTKVTEVRSARIHPDLRTAFDNLKIHLSLLTGYSTVKQVKKIETPPEDLTAPMFINGYSHKTGDDEGVVIKGYRKLENGKTVTLNTPFTRYTESEETQYKFLDDLIDRVERANTEVNLYLSGEKTGADPQQQLPFAENEAQNTNTEDLELVSEGDDEVWKDGKRPK